jgi:hypothetical protein
MTLLYRFSIDDEVHEVRLEVPDGPPPAVQARAFEEAARATAWLEHVGRLPRGVLKATD